MEVQDLTPVHRIWISRGSPDPSRDTPFRDIETEPEQFAVNTRCSQVAFSATIRKIKPVPERFLESGVDPHWLWRSRASRHLVSCAPRHPRTAFEEIGAWKSLCRETVRRLLERTKTCQ